MVLKKTLISTSLVFCLYAIYALIVFHFAYNEWDYFRNRGLIFFFDIYRFIAYLFILVVAIYLVGINSDLRVFAAMIFIQIIGFYIHYYSIYLYFGKAHYIGELNDLRRIEHNSFPEWLDFLIGYKKMLYTSLIELLLFSICVYIALKFRKPEWSILGRFELTNAVKSCNNDIIDSFNQ